MEIQNNNAEKRQTEETPATNSIDSRTLVRKHMEDQNHEFTDEELKNVTVSTESINLDEHPAIKALDE